MKYGYARVSTTHQDYKMQLDALRDRGVESAATFTDKKSGKDMQRPGWQKLLSIVKPGDSITFYSISRMSRNAEEGTAAYLALVDMGVGLSFIHEPHLDSEVFLQARGRKLDSIAKTGDGSVDTFLAAVVDAINGLMADLATNQIRIAFQEAETERINNNQRIKDGMKASGAGEKISAAKLGKTLTTKKSKAAKEIIRKHSKTFGGTLEDPEVIKLTGLARNTYYKYKRELAAE